MWFGPYIIKRVLAKGDYVLVDLDGFPLAQPRNGLYHKKYYAWSHVWYTMCILSIGALSVFFKVSHGFYWIFLLLDCGCQPLLNHILVMLMVLATVLRTYPLQRGLSLLQMVSKWVCKGFTFVTWLTTSLSIVHYLSYFLMLFHMVSTI